MKIVTLVENTASNQIYRKKHGLSLYIETTNHKLLFDLGPDDTFIHNAKLLGIDLAAVDTVIISHGHDDHGGALDQFLAVNHTAKIYLHREALSSYYVKAAFIKIPIGLKIKSDLSDRLILTGDCHIIDDELFLFADIKGQFHSRSNRALLAKQQGRYIPDAFSHEQNLIISDQDCHVLLTGCAHRGIENILTAAMQHNSGIGTVIGGFHLFNPTSKKSEPENTVKSVADGLSQYNVKFHTCHCTGGTAYNIMKGIMANQLEYLSAGMELLI